MNRSSKPPRAAQPPLPGLTPSISEAGWRLLRRAWARRCDPHGPAETAPGASALDRFERRSAARLAKDGVVAALPAYVLTQGGATLAHVALTDLGVRICEAQLPTARRELIKWRSDAEHAPTAEQRAWCAAMADRAAERVRAWGGEVPA